MVTRSLAFAAAAFFAFAAAHAASEEGLADAIVKCSQQPGEQAQFACYSAIAARLKAQAAAQAPAPATLPPPQAAAAPPPPSVAEQTQAPSVAAQAPPVAAPPPAAAAQAPAAPKSEGSAWYDVGSWFGGGGTPPPKREVFGTPADFGRADMPFQDAGPEPLDHITASVASVTYNYFRRFTISLDNGQVWRQEEGDTNVARFDEDKKYLVTIRRGFLGTYTLKIEGGWGVYRVHRVK